LTHELGMDEGGNLAVKDSDHKVLHTAGG
jgi:hypothetical protein